MVKPSRVKPFLLLIASGLLPGCTSPELPQAPVPTAAPSPQQPLGKPGAPVDISYELLSEPRLGQPLEIQITTNALRPNQSIALQLNPDRGLALASAARLAARPLPLDERRLDRVVVTPLAEGRVFLNVLATVTLNGQQMLKAISIPIQVGAPAQPPVATQLDAEGTPIRVMPAEESTGP